VSRGSPVPALPYPVRVEHQPVVRNRPARSRAPRLMGFAALYPSYGISIGCRIGRGTKPIVIRPAGRGDQTASTAQASRPSIIDAHSNAEPRAISKKRRRSALVPLTVAFGDVQGDRLRGTPQLVPRGPVAALQALGHLVWPRYMPDRNPVDIELLMPEWHFFSDYDNDNDNVCIPCATYC